VQLGTLTQQAALFLEASVRIGMNIVVSGGTQAGKTTLLNCLCAEAEGRIVSAEDQFELNFAAADWARLQIRLPNLEGSGEVTLRDLVREILRMRPDHIVLGETRGPECLDVLLALNSGKPGMATIHANSAREAVDKLCDLPLLAAQNITSDLMVRTVARCVDLVVFVAHVGGGRRRVLEILAVTGRAEGGVIETADIFTADQELRLVRAGGFPPHPQRYAYAGIDLSKILASAPRPEFSNLTYPT
jgi:pilus assembly protein CpaF